jgi:Subtilase family
VSVGRNCLSANIIHLGHRMGGRMATCLTILTVAGVMACTDTPVQVPPPDVSAAVAGTDSVALTYICGNMFRIRNSSFEPRSVRWDIYNAAPADTGSLKARGRDVGAAYVDLFVTSRTKGTMRLFVGTTLIATKANGNKAACSAPVDTSAVPRVRSKWFGVSDEPRARDLATNLVARTILMITFDSLATSSSQLRALLGNLNAQIVRVMEPGFYYLRIPDPGVSADSLNAIEARVRSFPFVSRVTFVPVEFKAQPHGTRYPSDGSGSTRADQLGGNSGTWPARALRLHPAWWCENGQYSAPRVRIAALEANFPDSIPADLAASVSVVRASIDSGSGTVPSIRDGFQDHGTSIAGLIAARGDNGVGTAGVLWRTDLTIFSLSRTSATSGRNALEYFERTIQPGIVSAAPRVLSFSTDVAPPATANVDQLHVLQRGMFLATRDLLEELPKLLIVISAGNDTLVGPIAGVNPYRLGGLLSALMSLKLDSRYGDRIVVVGATDISRNRAVFSNAISGQVDLYALGKTVPLLNRTGQMYFDDGTSFSAPIVAGIAGQLLTVDSTLTAAEVKQLLLNGALDPVENANGDNVAPSPVGNTSDVVYEADAFGSLRSLSGMKPDIPICDPSFAYWKNSALAPAGPKGWRAIRYGGSFDDRFDQPGMPGRESGYALAPGGRLLATGAGLLASRAGGVRLRRLLSGAWTDSTTVADWDLMQFGEKDVLYARGVGGAADTVPNVEYRISGPGRSGALRQAFNSTAQRVVRIAMRPDGEGVAIVAERSHELFLTLVDGAGVSSSAVSLGAPSASPQIVHAEIFWRPDSRALVVTQAARNTPVSTSQAWGTNVKFFDVSSAGAPNFRANVPTSSAVGQVVTGRWGSGNVRFDLIGFRELESAECNTFASRATASGVAISTSAVDHNEFCGENRSTPPNPGGGGCSDLCENACCFGIFRINKQNFPIARLRADSLAKRVNH